MSRLYFQKYIQIRFKKNVQLHAENCTWESEHSTGSELLPFLETQHKISCKNYNLRKNTSHWKYKADVWFLRRLKSAM